MEYYNVNWDSVEMLGKTATWVVLDLDESAGIYKINVIDINGSFDEKLHQRTEEQSVEVYYYS